MKNFLGIFLAASVVLEILISERTEYQTALAACQSQECRTEFQTKVALVQGEIDKQAPAPAATAAVTWGDITTAIIPNMGGGQ